MCVGSFVQTHTQRGSPVDKRQVLLGDEAGGLQVLDGFELIPYAQLDYPIADIVSVPRKALTGHSGPDVVVCATCSNHIYVLCNRHIIGTYSAGFWPASLGLYFQPNGRKPRIAVAETRAGAVADTARNLVHILALDIAS
ncbi:hypothetical protein GGI12_001012 [Dipsacomyces acuminosporus]|nr:hypothetical protein GGI12_001012 [Dipsacomyces acuminosporus]